MFYQGSTELDLPDTFGGDSMAWLSHGPAYIIAYENFVADKKSSNAKTKTKVTGLLKKFKSYEFLLKVATYLNLLEMIVSASKLFESNEFIPQEILVMIMTTKMEKSEKVEEIKSNKEFMDSFFSTFLVSELENSQSWLVGGSQGNLLNLGRNDSVQKIGIISVLTFPWIQLNRKQLQRIRK